MSARGRIRPDLLIEREGHVVGVLYAKFKNDTQVGRYEKEGVSREDLYQMSTYLYHYGREDHPLLGLVYHAGARGSAGGCGRAESPSSASPGGAGFSHHGVGCRRARLC